MCLTIRLLTQSLMAVTLGLSTYAMAADTYPTKPVRLIVPFPPGGSNDIVGRLVGYALASGLGQQVVVDNRGGAGGMIGSEIAAHAQPDGYTLLIASVAFAYNPSIFKSLIKFDPERSFATVALLGTGPSALTVNPKLPVRTTRELIALANA
ncbi:MAG: tripartite tricarboxylate transporter substrate-binding protein, partial [Burkholderiales bacterium]|nr:tripartite tricarboxylate transporter substrate-binding protein [Burkholderiales bacterium]